MKKIHVLLLGFIFGAGTFVFAATWQGTGSIRDGQIISAPILQENLDYLYERSWDFEGGNTLFTQNQVSINDVSPADSLSLDVQGDTGSDRYCDGEGQNCFTALDIVNLMSHSHDSNTPVVTPTTTQQDPLQVACDRAGGEIVVVDGGVRVCRIQPEQDNRPRGNDEVTAVYLQFNGDGGLAQNLCPSGMKQYQNWSSTQSRTCGDTTCNYTGVGQCSTGAHGWSDTAQETCQAANGREGEGLASSPCDARRVFECRASVTAIGCVLNSFES